MSKEKNIQAQADRSLTTKQLETLKLICRFRFATTELIATNKNKKRDATINAHVRVLHERGYIGRRYDASYKLRGKHAAYYMLPKGLSALKEYDSQSCCLARRFTMIVLHLISSSIFAWKLVV